MHDAMSWALPLGRVAGIRIRLHLLFLLFIVFQILHGLHSGHLDFHLKVCAILFLSVLLHEFGHCFAARAVGGEATDILMWPLGGLAFVSNPQNARDEFIVVIWGPLVNVIIALVSGIALVLLGFWPPLNPLNPVGELQQIRQAELIPSTTAGLMGYIFGINWVLFLFNLTPAFPMDGGRILRTVLWPKMGLMEATRITLRVALVCALGFGIVAVFGQDLQSRLVLIAIAVFVFLYCDLERRRLDAGLLAEDSCFGYDFSQGYTSLNRTEARESRPGIIDRWKKKRANARAEREEVERAEQERTMDQILAKISETGMASLTEKEREFLSKVSAQKRNQSDD